MSARNSCNVNEQNSNAAVGQNHGQAEDHDLAPVCRICLEGEKTSWQSCTTCPDGGNTSKKKKGGKTSPKKSKCKKEDAPAHELIAPCLCRGSGKWVHRGCLDEWRAMGAQTNTACFTHCPQCNFEYRFDKVLRDNEAAIKERKKKFRAQVCGDCCLGVFGMNVFLVLCSLLMMSAKWWQSCSQT